MMSFIKYIDGTFYYDNPVLAFVGSDSNYENVVTVSPELLQDGKYMLDYTFKGGSSQTNRKAYFRILVNGVEVDEWIKEPKDTADRLPYTGVSKPLDLLSGVQNIELEAKTDSPADVFIDSFRFTLKKWD